MDTLHTSLTFNDVLLRPGYTGFERNEVNLETKLSRNIIIAAPFVSAPMDTVTESRLAIALGEMGGIGVIHRNLSPQDQSEEVRKIKATGQLAVAAVGTRDGYKERVEALIGAGVDAILIDSAHGFAKIVIDAVKFVKDTYAVDVIGGSVATAKGAKALIKAGADGLRVGMGPGAICSTRIISGMGVPQLSSLMEIAPVAKKAGVPMIADGGIIHSGDVVKALVAGASTVMMGRMFAATEESPGKLITIGGTDVPKKYRIEGAIEQRFKTYRGMGSLGAIQRGLEVNAEDEFHGNSFDSTSVLIAEGVEGLVPCSGTVQQLIEQFRGGVVSGLYYIGAKTIPEAQKKGKFTRITQASLQESHPHDLVITDNGGNYYT